MPKEIKPYYKKVYTTTSTTTPYTTQPYKEEKYETEAPVESMPKYYAKNYEAKHPSAIPYRETTKYTEGGSQGGYLQTLEGHREQLELQLCR